MYIYIHILCVFSILKLNTVGNMASNINRHTPTRVSVCIYLPVPVPSLVSVLVSVSVSVYVCANDFIFH